MSFWTPRAVSITLDDLDLEKRQVLIRGKGDKERVVPLTDQAVEANLPVPRVRHIPHLTVRPDRGRSRHCLAT